MLLARFGDPDGFQPGEVADPVAGPGQALLRVRATSVNPADTKIRQHGGPLAPPLPAILGMDMAGVVEAVGEGVTTFQPGDEVYGCAGGLRDLPGALAERMVADVRLLAHKPASLSLRQAAALPLVAITAWEGLVDRAGVGEGHHVLVYGGTGGVGHVAVQIAKARGARVAATASSPEKAAIARRLGADEVIDHREESVEGYVDRVTGGRGFDVVFDTVGGDNLETAFTAAALQGQVVSLVTRRSYDLGPVMTKGLSLHVVFMLIPMLHDRGRERHGEILRRVAELVDQGGLAPLIDPAVFHLEEAGAAHRHLEEGRATGKVVIDVS